jgi:hypothetical protein
LRLKNLQFCLFFKDLKVNADALPHLVDIKISGKYDGRGEKDKERRVYSREFKAEAAALVQKHEKPARQPWI